MGFRYARARSCSIVFKPNEDTLTIKLLAHRVDAMWRSDSDMQVDSTYPANEWMNLTGRNIFVGRVRLSPEGRRRT